jgi:hypothetical protein
MVFIFYFWHWKSTLTSKNEQYTDGALRLGESRFVLMGAKPTSNKLRSQGWDARPNRYKSSGGVLDLGYLVNRSYLKR